MNLQPAQGSIVLLQRAIKHHNGQTAHYLPTPLLSIRTYRSKTWAQCHNQGLTLSLNPYNC